MAQLSRGCFEDKKLALRDSRFGAFVETNIARHAVMLDSIHLIGSVGVSSVPLKKHCYSSLVKLGRTET